MFEVGTAYLDLVRSRVPHLWIVIAQPDPDERVIVSITSERLGMDPTCSLQAGEHPFIGHQSWAFFGKATVVTARDLSVWRSRGNIEMKALASDALIGRLREGALDSQFTPRYVKQAVRDCAWSPRS